ncbi:MAG: hypothetical protein AAF383_23380 [Cyanobacteria bacterium P01_A01_bin.83]
MEFSRERILQEIEILGTTRLEDVADFDGTYYTLKDQNSALNAAIKFMEIHEGRITRIRMYSEKGGSSGLKIRN